MHDDHGTLLAVVVALLGTFLKRVIDAGHVTQVDNTAGGRHAHDHGTHLLRVAELTLYTQGVGLVTDVEGTAGDVAVLSSDK